MFKKTLIIYDNGWKFKLVDRETKPIVIHGNEIIAWVFVVLLGAKIVFGY